MTSIQKRGHRKKEHIVLVIGLFLFIAVLLFINPSYTALTSRGMMSSGNLVSSVDLIVIIVGAVLLYRLIVRKK